MAKRVVKRAGFTLFEIVMVIVIMGIVAMIGTNIIAHMYEGYIRSKYINNLEQQTELALEMITSRLQYRVKASTIVRQKGTNSIDWLNSQDLNDTYDVLEWIGFDYESFRGESNGTLMIPGWSGFVDLENPATDATQIYTSGSNLDFAVQTIKDLSYNEIDLNDTDPTNTNNPVLIFKKLSNYTFKSFGWDWTSTDHNATLPVHRDPANNHILVFDENITAMGVTHLKEQYRLAWTAYALVPEGDKPDDFNLTLYYNYQPWYNEKYTDGKKALIAQHVSSFNFLQSGNTVRIKLCIQDGNQTGIGFGFCKEKAVF